MRSESLTSLSDHAEAVLVGCDDVEGAFSRDSVDVADAGCGDAAGVNAGAEARRWGGQ